MICWLRWLGCWRTAIGKPFCLFLLVFFLYIHTIILCKTLVIDHLRSVHHRHLVIIAMVLSSGKQADYIEDDLFTAGAPTSLTLSLFLFLSLRKTHSHFAFTNAKLTFQIYSKCLPISLCYSYWMSGATVKTVNSFHRFDISIENCTKNLYITCLFSGKGAVSTIYLKITVFLGKTICDDAIRFYTEYSCWIEFQKSEGLLPL